MEEVLDTLPERPATVGEVFSLMETPRTVGLASPVFCVESGCVGLYCEHEGKMKSVGYTGDEWMKIEESDQVDEFLHGDPAVSATLLEEISDKLAVERGNDFSQYAPEVQFEAPFGFSLKMCIRHRELSEYDFAEFARFPHFLDVNAVCRSRSSGIVGVCALEEPFYLDEIASIVFAYFDPEVSTWRIVDIIGHDLPMDAVNQVCSETSSKAQEHYDDIKMVAGSGEFSI